MNVIRTLVIDDNVSDAKLLSIFLKKISAPSIDMHHAGTLRQGMELLKSETYDLLILDLNLPDSAGIDTVKSVLPYIQVPTVVLTGEEDDEIGQEAIKIGAQDFLHKGSFNQKSLKKTLMYAIERFKLFQEIDTKRTQFLNLIKALPDALIVLNNNNEIILYNEAFLDLCKIESSELSFEFLQTTIVNDVDFNRINEIRSNADTTTMHIELRNKKNQIRTCFMSMQPWLIETLNETTEGTLFILKDITNQLELERITKEKELTEQSIIMKQQFLANMSHEMRTPLNIINGTIYLLKSTSLNREQNNYLNDQKFATENLLDIINNILNYSQLEKGVVPLEESEFNLREFFEKLTNSSKTLLHNKKIDMLLHYEKALKNHYLADHFKLQQILQNILANAIKFTQEGKINIEVRLLEKLTNHNMVQIAIQDTGIGIPEHMLDKIFNSFTQVEYSNKKKIQGTGLGLSIVKELVHIMQGSISLKSKEGEGSLFAITLPLKKSILHNEDDFEPEHNQISEVTQKLNVLVVEDHVPNQLLTKTFLINWFEGVHVDIADNGIEALKLLEVNKYNLVLMDLQMPEMDGFETTLHIRQSDKPYQHIPIIAVTAHALQHETNKCIEVGMDDFITKPIEPDLLKDKITKFIKNENLSSNSSTNTFTHNIHQLEIKTTTEFEFEGKPVHLNLEYLQKLSMNNEIMLLALLEQLLKDAPLELKELNILLEQQEWKKLGTLAHKMKATASYMGLMYMIDFFNTLIQNARTETNVDDIPAQVSIVNQAFNACLPEVAHAVNAMKLKL